MASTNVKKGKLSKMSKWKTVQDNVSKLAWEHKHPPPPWMKAEETPTSTLYTHSTVHPPKLPPKVTKVTEDDQRKSELKPPSASSNPLEDQSNHLKPRSFIPTPMIAKEKINLQSIADNVDQPQREEGTSGVLPGNRRMKSLNIPHKTTKRGEENTSPPWVNQKGSSKLNDDDNDKEAEQLMRTIPTQTIKFQTMKVEQKSQHATRHSPGPSPSHRKSSHHVTSPISPSKVSVASPFSPEKERLQYFRNFCVSRDREKTQKQVTKEKQKEADAPISDGVATVAFSTGLHPGLVKVESLSEVDCLYCLSTIEVPVELISCGHLLCKVCADTAIEERLLPVELACPRCPLPQSSTFTSTSSSPASQRHIYKAMKLFKESTNLYIPVLRRIQRGQYADWSHLTVPALKDLDTSHVLLREAAELGLPQAQYSLSMTFLRSEGVFPSLSEDRKARLSVEWVVRAAASGVLPAQYRLGCFLESGYGGLPIDHSKAASWFAKAARKGHVHALLNLGACCWEGRGVLVDRVRAVKLFQRAAQGGCKEAQYNLGLALWNGIGIDRSCGAAIQWWSKAAEKGDVLAQYNLGGAFKNGEGVVKDIGMASYWWSLAALNGGFSDAANNLGTACWNGEIGDKTAALEWYKLAAEKGHAEAQRNYAESLLEMGEASEAIKWLRYAAESGEWSAARSLAVIYKQGIPEKIPKDLEKSKHWETRASSLSFEPAQSLIQHASSYQVQAELLDHIVLSSPTRSPNRQQNRRRKGHSIDLDVLDEIDCLTSDNLDTTKQFSTPPRSRHSLKALIDG